MNETHSTCPCFRRVLNATWQLALIGLVCCLSSFAFASEKTVLRFKEQPTVEGNVVRLGDLIEVLGGSSPAMTKLLDSPLGPAPTGSTQQNWHSEDVMQHLQLRGVHANSMRWSGPSKTILQRAVAHSAGETTSMAPAFLQERAVRQAETLVAQAVREYINYKTGQRDDLRIQVRVPPIYVSKLQIKRNIVAVGGGQEPWQGPQEFVLDIKDGTRTVRIKVRADVALPPMVVSAARPLRREEILSAEALTYRPLPKSASRTDVRYFTNIDQLIGQQVRRAVSTGLPIAEDFVGNPILISRNALVQVESIAGSVVVRTQARSVGSGSQGDLIEVEVLSNRQRLFATVVDSMTVRVAAQANRDTR